MMRWSYVLGLSSFPAIASALFVVGHPVHAASWHQKMFGHSIQISEVDFEERLLVNDKVLLTNRYISIDETVMIDGIPVAVGDTSAGGNMCDASPFVLSFPKDGAPKLDGPLDSCHSVVTKVESDKIVFETSAMPSGPGERWTWTPAGGISTSTPIAFSPNPGKGWATLRSRETEHPADLFGYGELSPALEEAIAQRRNEILRIAEGPGSGEFKGDRYVGSACQPHSCNATGFLVVADIKLRKLFLAWKEEGRKIELAPAVKEWPKDVRTELSVWAKRWAQ